MASYIYEQSDWPNLRWDHAALSNALAEVHMKQGALLGRMEALGFRLREQTVLSSLTLEIQKSSEIEGELLDEEQVRSSIAKKLGMDIGALAQVDRNVDGVVEMTLDATQNFDQPLTAERLWSWHSSVFPSPKDRILVGHWRDDRLGPMQVVSGPIGREKVHYQAPPASEVAEQMELFSTWFNGPDPSDAVVKAGLAHLWFVTVHPFDDGNGRIGRAITEMFLARSEQSPQRFYSMSAQIRKERRTYYEVLEKTQKNGIDVTDWLLWFLGCLDRALTFAQDSLTGVLRKARFWQEFAEVSVNERQRKILNRVLDGIEGKLTSSKWAKMAKCSQDTAVRDLTDLLAKGLLVKGLGGGRSTSYSLPGGE
jgi:Fic family protein